MEESNTRSSELVAQAHEANRAGSFDEALSLLDEAIELLKDLPESEVHARAYREVGLGLRGIGDVAESARAYELAQEIAQRIGSVEEEAFAVNGLAVARHAEGDLDTADMLYAKAARMAALNGLLRLTGMVEQNRGVIANIRGDLAAAKVRYGAARVAFEMTGDDQGVAWTSNNLGMLDTDLGDPERAMAEFDKALSAAERAGDRGMISRIRVNRVEAMVAMDDLDGAESAVVDALEGIEAQNYGLLRGEALKLHAVVKRRRGEAAEAARMAREAASIATEAPDRLLAGEARRELALALSELGEREEARRALEDALLDFESVGASDDADDVRLRLEGSGEA